MKNGLNYSKKLSTPVGVVSILAVLSTIIALIPTPTHAGFKDVFLALASGAPFVGAEEAIAAEPIEEIAPLVLPVAEDKPPMRTLTVIATAYSSDPNQTDATPCAPAMWKYDLCEQFLTYGHEDTIAANFLPLGTKVRFPELYGDKIFVVRDRMNAKYNFDRIGYYRIDFYKAEATAEGQMDTIAAKREAINFGVKRGLKMEVLAYSK